MDIHYFQEFVMLAEIKNYWAAAEQLYMGQSSLSKHIKALEEHLGAPLFERTSRKVELTEFGEKMLPYARKIARLEYEYQAAAYRYRQQGSQALNIGSIPVLPHYFITDLLLRYQKEFPGVEIHMQEADSLLLREWLLEGKCEIAFYRDSAEYVEHDPDKEARLEKIPYWEDRLAAILPKDHHLAALPQIELSRLAEENFVFIKQETMPYTLCMRVCKEAGFVPKVLFTSHNLEVLMDLVAKGGCVSLQFFNQAEFFKKTFYFEHLVSVPVFPPVKTRIYLAHRKDVPLSEAALQFIRYIRFKENQMPGKGV